LHQRLTRSCYCPATEIFQVNLLGNFLDNLRPSGSTNLYGALETALGFGDRGLFPRTRRLLQRAPEVRCERKKPPVALREADVAVAVSHNDQKNALRARLADEGLGEVVVNTANKLQGLTFEVVIAWHPLAGLLDADAFHLDPGRLCVMLTRHRHACIVVGRAGDRELVCGIPPATPSYVGWDSNPALDGWYVHEGVFRALEEHRMSVG